MSANALLLAGGTPLITVDAADFDGTNDYMLRGADLSGIADGKSGILSFWYRIDGGDGIMRRILITDLASSSGFMVSLDGGNDFAITGANVDTSTALSIYALGNYLAGGAWIHLLASWDTNTSAAHIYISDVSNLYVGSIANKTIDYTRPNWGVSADTAGTYKNNGCLAELYFAPNQYLDFSDVNNRRKFISAAGKPVHLGVDGSLPTGTAPIIYLHLDDGEAVANFATNRGTGGNFTITGTLDTASTSPSD